MSEHNGNSTWKALAYGAGGISQALIMLLLYLIFQEQAHTNIRLEAVEQSAARMEGIISMMKRSPIPVVDTTKAPRQAEQEQIDP